MHCSMQLPGDVQFFPEMHQKLFGGKALPWPSEGAIVGVPADI